MRHFVTETSLPSLRGDQAFLSVKRRTIDKLCRVDYPPIHNSSHFDLLYNDEFRRVGNQEKITSF
jgi:hypothetical protein